MNKRHYLIAILFIALGSELVLSWLPTSRFAADVARADIIRPVEGNGPTGYFPDQFDMSDAPRVEQHVEAF